MCGRFDPSHLNWRDIHDQLAALIPVTSAPLNLEPNDDVRPTTAQVTARIVDGGWVLERMRWGLVPDMGGATLLRELVPIDVAKELAMTGRIVSGAEAHALRLVTRITDAPLEQARSLAAEIATRSPDAVSAAKFLLQESWHGDETEALAAERKWQRRVIAGRNQRIAVRRNAPRGPEQPELPFHPRRLGN